jgi:hypothetical protein
MLVTKSASTKYIAGTGNTVPLDKAPVAVAMARDFIQDRAKVALNLDLTINEVLSVAYFEKQKMNVRLPCGSLLHLL